MMDNIWLLCYMTMKKNRKTSFTYRPPETTPECCLISGRRRWCFSDEGTPALPQSDKLLWRLACDRGAYRWSLQGEKHSSKLHRTVFNTNFSWGKKWVDLPLPLRLSSTTVLRLPRGANCRAKQSGWMLMPTRETMQGCCRECNMLASWRNSEKLRKASADCRCFTMVSGAKSGRVKKTGKVQTKMQKTDLCSKGTKGLMLTHLCSHFIKFTWYTHLLEYYHSDYPYLAYTALYKSNYIYLTWNHMIAQSKPVWKPMYSVFVYVTHIVPTILGSC